MLNSESDDDCNVTYTTRHSRNFFEEAFSFCLQFIPFWSAGLSVESVIKKKPTLQGFSILILKKRIQNFLERNIMNKWFKRNDWG